MCAEWWFLGCWCQSAWTWSLLGISIAAAPFLVGFSKEEDVFLRPDPWSWISGSLACYSSASVILSRDVGAIEEAKAVFEPEKKFTRLLKLIRPACLLSAPPHTFSLHVSKWLSKRMTLMGPWSRSMLRRRGSVMVWSPQRVMTCGRFWLRQPFVARKTWSFQLTLMCTNTEVGYCWLSVCGYLRRRNYTGSREDDCGHLKQLILMLSSFAARIQAAESDSQAE